jgi:hypothetical protein
MSEENKVLFITSDNEEIEFTVLEQTTLNGKNYLLVVCDEDEEESEALILKEVLTENEDVVYDIVEDDVELDAVSSVFAELLEDYDIV